MDQGFFRDLDRVDALSAKKAFNKKTLKALISKGAPGVMRTLGRLLDSNLLFSCYFGKII